MSILGQLLSDLVGRRKRGEGENPIADYFYSNTGRLIDKWHHYFEVYHRHFAPFRGRSPVVVEIGVFHGGSLDMWRHYFGPGAQIVGVDIDPRCKAFEAPGTSVLIGDQADRAFLAEVRRQVPHIDVLIDDGGHTMVQQITTFEELYPHVQPNGIYLCEDLHTSYIPAYGGGLRREGTFIEFSKQLIDRLHSWYLGSADVDPIARTAFALHFYDSMLVVEKRPIKPPRSMQTGVPSF